MLGGSSRSVGRPYKEATHWLLDTDIPEDVANLEVLDCDPSLFSGVRVVFSALDSSVAGELETKFAEAGFAVFSNAKNHRTDPDVPILIPQVNPESIRLVSTQATYPGYIVTNSNCATTGLVVALRPLQRAFGVAKVYVTTLQSISGAGYPGAASLDILDNVIPFISGEEEKLQSEPLKILEDDFAVVAQATRVPVTEGHTLCITVQLKTQATASQVIEALQANLPFQEFQAKYPLTLNFESLHVLADRPPQPKLDRMRGNGLTTTVGRVRGGGDEFQLVAVSHNTLAGAAFGSIKNAELALEAGLLSN
jgi:aspartate-semialdehyde dehydrogenase